MKRKLFLGLFFGLIISTVHAQPYPDWVNTFGGNDFDEGIDIARDLNGNIITVGSFFGNADFDPGPGTYQINNNSGNDALFIQKVDNQGLFDWAKAVIPSNGASFVGANVVITDYNNAVLVLGYFSGTVDFDPGSGVHSVTSAGPNSNMFLLKLDYLGDFQWVKTWSSGDTVEGYGMDIDHNGNLYVVGFFDDTVDFDPGSGTFNLTSNGSFDGYVLQLDLNGDFVNAVQLGGSQFDGIIDVKINSHLNPVVAGGFSGSMDIDPDPGNTQTVTSQGSFDTYFLELDANNLHAVNYTLIQSPDQVVPHRIGLDSSDNVYLGGTFQNQLDLDPGPGSNTVTSAGSNDIYFVVLTRTGQYLAGGAIGGTDDDYFSDMQVTPAGDIFVTGDLLGTMDLDPTASGVHNETSAGFTDTFVAKYNHSLGFEWAGVFASTDDVIANGLAVNPSNGDTFVTGSFGDITDFDPTSATDNRTPSGFGDVFVVKLHQPTAAVENVAWNQVSVYPNPFKNSLKIHTPEVPEQIFITDASGRILRQWKPVSVDAEVRLEGPAGIYYVHISYDNESRVYPVIKR